MNQRLMRPTAALFPLVLLVSQLSGDRDLSLALFFYYCLIQLCSLCSVESFRNAAARESGVRRVDRCFSGTWLMILVGVAIASFPVAMLHMLGMGISAWMAPFCAAVCIIIEQLFEERMYALSRPADGMILSIISNLLLLAGLLVDAGRGMEAPVVGFYTGCAAALGTVISIVAAYFIEPMHGFSLLPRNIAFFPRAAVQSLLYIAAMAACLQFGLAADIFFGLTIWRLSRTVYRRTQDESRPLNLLLCASVALPLLLKAALGANAVAGVHLFPFALSAMVAFICAAAVFCAPSLRLYLGMALLIAAVFLDIAVTAPVPPLWNRIAIAALSLAALALNLHKAFLKKARRPVYNFGE